MAMFIFTKFGNCSGVNVLKFRKTETHKAYMVKGVILCQNTHIKQSNEMQKWNSISTQSTDIENFKTVTVKIR